MPFSRINGFKVFKLKLNKVVNISYSLYYTGSMRSFEKLPSIAPSGVSLTKVNPTNETSLDKYNRRRSSKMNKLFGKQEVLLKRNFEVQCSQIWKVDNYLVSKYSYNFYYNYLFRIYL